MTSPDPMAGGGDHGSSLPPACVHAELIDAYVDGEVSAAERRQAERHLASCAFCRDEADSLSALHGLLAAERHGPEARAVLSPRRVSSRRRAAVSLAALVALPAGVTAAVATFAPGVRSAASAFVTVSDFAITVSLLGAGLLEASWRGLGTTMSSAFAPTGPVLFVGGAAAVGVTGLLVSLVRRGSRPAAQRTRR